MKPIVRATPTTASTNTSRTKQTSKTSPQRHSPLLKQENVRQANELGGVPGDWTSRFDVDGSAARPRGATTTSYASVSVLVFEGPLDADIS